MVEMEVGEDDVGDVVVGEVLLFERLCEVVGGLGLVDLFEFVVVPIADAGVDEDETLVGTNQEASQGEGDAIILIGGGGFLPEGSGDDAVHGAAVDRKCAVVDYVVGGHVGAPD